MKNFTYKTGASAALSVLLISGGFAQAATTLPPIQRSGQLEYLSGGVGKDEAKAIESASKQWPLTMEFVVKGKPRDEFAADVKVDVRDAKGHEVLQADSVGPFVLAKLAPGKYTVNAALAGKTLHKSVVVKAGEPAKALFIWPTGTGETRS
jgi:hypothetical protein